MFGIIPAPLSSIDVSVQFKDPRVVWHCAEGDVELIPGTAVIEVTVVKVQSRGQMRLARIRIQSQSGVDCRLCQLQTERRVIQTCPVDPIVSLRQLAIRQKKNRVSRQRLVKQLDGFEKVCLTTEAIIERLFDQWGS